MKFSQLDSSCVGRGPLPDWTYCADNYWQHVRDTASVAVRRVSMARDVANLFGLRFELILALQAIEPAYELSNAEGWYEISSTQ